MSLVSNLATNTECHPVCINSIGLKRAERFYELGYRTLDDLKEDPDLTHAQKIGLQYFSVSRLSSASGCAPAKQVYHDSLTDPPRSTGFRGAHPTQVIAERPFRMPQC